MPSLTWDWASSASDSFDSNPMALWSALVVSEPGTTDSLLGRLLLPGTALAQIRCVPLEIPIDAVEDNIARPAGNSPVWPDRDIPDSIARGLRHARISCFDQELRRDCRTLTQRLDPYADRAARGISAI